jgi:hypothetical protein
VQKRTLLQQRNAFVAEEVPIAVDRMRNEHLARVGTIEMVRIVGFDLQMKASLRHEFDFDQVGVGLTLQLAFSGVSHMSATLFQCMPGEHLNWTGSPL